MSVEDTLVKMAEDKYTPLVLQRGYLWVSKVQPSAKRARELAELAIGTVGREVCEHPKAKVVKERYLTSTSIVYRGVVYAGRRSRREVAKE